MIISPRFHCMFQGNHLYLFFTFILTSKLYHKHSDSICTLQCISLHCSLHGWFQSWQSAHFIYQLEDAFFLVHIKIKQSSLFIILIFSLFKFDKISPETIILTKIEFYIFFCFSMRAVAVTNFFFWGGGCKI